MNFFTMLLHLISGTKSGTKSAGTFFFDLDGPGACLRCFPDVIILFYLADVTILFHKKSIPLLKLSVFGLNSLSL